MKSAILLVLILSATAASALEGWRKSMSDIEAIPLPGIKAELVNHSEAGTEVRVTNESGGGLLYHGYYAARPVLYFEEMRDGQWVETTWDWAGPR